MIEEVKGILGTVLQLGTRASEWEADTELLGSIPELDSMAVVGIITALEDFYGFYVDDDEISAETFSTLGTLTLFVETKVQG